jgi:L-ascorbate metabolism protein UlaG (beta-lactamase superfamily)
MVITWYGQSCFKVQNGETVIICDPFSKEIGLVPPRGQAHLVTISHQHLDHNNSESLSGEPLIINGPGEYEVKGVNIQGILSYHDDKEGKDRGTNTIYLIEVEGIKICHLGDLGQKKLTDEQVEEIDEVDILMIPVGGVYTIDGEQAVEIINQIEPRIVIPMHYKIPGLNVKLDNVEVFLKEMGASKKVPQDKLTVKKKDLPEEETEVVVMKI